VTALAPATEHQNQADPDETPRRVSYLFGAGATQGSVQYAGSGESLVMPGLIERLLDSTNNAYVEDFSDHAGLRHLVNDVVDDRTDFEHLLTFLADTPSHRYQDFAERLKKVFSTVLRRALAEVRTELGDEHAALYAALLDMHDVPGSGEHLVGILTLNYDNFLEYAIEHALGRTVDYGVEVANPSSADGQAPISVLKLHGSFNWRSIWPIEVAEESDVGLWIPPGIRKAKSEYPFNAIWGRARELLDCDVLRIVGCNLGPNDWDLVSLLFTTMHGRESAQPYEIEVIGSPAGADNMRKTFPYLSSRSLLEIRELGAQFVAELLGTDPTDFSDLDEAEQKRAREAAVTKIANPFQHWLRLKGELMHRDLESISTERGLFRRFIEEST
jgi:hypothetical protein